MDEGKELRYYIKKAGARKFYARKWNKVSNTVFDMIAWDNIDIVLEGSAKMYMPWWAYQGPVSRLK